MKYKVEPNGQEKYLVVDTEKLKNPDYPGPLNIAECPTQDAANKVARALNAYDGDETVPMVREF